MARRLGKTPLFAALQHCARKAEFAGRHPHLDVEEVLDMFRSKRLSRRRFLQYFGGATLALSSATLLSSCSKRNFSSDFASAPRVAIIGAGLAGLSCAYRLQKAGIKATIFEAAKRTGGRCFTARGLLGPLLTTEVGGEFIDSTHSDLLALARDFGLELYDFRDESESMLQEVFYFGGQIRTEREIVSEFVPLAKRIARDSALLADESKENPHFLYLDHLSIAEYLDRIEATGWMRELLSTAYCTEFGLDIGEQSALNLVYLISTDLKRHEFHVYGDSDERFKVKGGNEQIAKALTARLQNQIHHEWRLESIADRGSGQRLSFATPSGSQEIDADFTVLAIPFSLLRSVQIKATLPPQKVRAIRELAYGTNSKIFLSFKDRPWRRTNHSGNFFSDGPSQSGWDSSRLQPGTAGGMTVYFGGQRGVDTASFAFPACATQLVGGVGSMFPSAPSSYAGTIEHFHWPSFELSKGSYSTYRPGQWTSINGFEIEPVGNLLFAGEHCSSDFQGYMNGAAETGNLAANIILSRI